MFEERLRMSQPTLPSDLRRLPWRPDLAATSLKGFAPKAERYSAPVLYRAKHANVPMRSAPDSALGLSNELIYGEAFDVYELTESWAWGQAQQDGYVGYVPANALACEALSPDRIVTALRSFVYPAASIKREPVLHLPLGARVRALAVEGDFTRTELGYLFGAHLAEILPPATDFVTEAERYLGVPYLWGGRSSLGLDCSGLVQQALWRVGIAAPRDSDMQAKALGEALDPVRDRAHIQRGDFLFWPGHVAIAQDGARMIHATGSVMQVISEPIDAAIARIQAKTGHTLSGLRRLKRQ
jgi:cell wall-associated NlpC family hydrolase